MRRQGLRGERERDGRRSTERIQNAAESDAEIVRWRHGYAEGFGCWDPKAFRGQPKRHLPIRNSGSSRVCSRSFPFHIQHDRSSQTQLPWRLRYLPINSIWTPTICLLYCLSSAFSISTPLFPCGCVFYFCFFGGDWIWFFFSELESVSLKDDFSIIKCCLSDNRLFRVGLECIGSVLYRV